MTKDEIIDDVYRVVTEVWPQEERDKFFLAPIIEVDALYGRYELMMYIRNIYRLWERPWTPVMIDGIDHSPDHPENLSYHILEEVWKRGPK